MSKGAKRHGLGDIQSSLFSHTFLQRPHASIFRCGLHSITLRELTHDLDCPFPISARRLDLTLRNNGITNLKTLFKLGVHGLASLQGVGDGLCYVATIILDHFGFDMVTFTAEEPDEPAVRFGTMKRQQRDQQTRRQKKHKADRKHLPSDFGAGSTPPASIAVGQ